MTLIDTAEMYGEGAAEELIAEAIAGRRAEVFLVSKVYPHNATRNGAALLLDTRGSYPLLSQYRALLDTGNSVLDTLSLAPARAYLVPGSGWMQH